jgi:GNAT superfamily N-acetyltransferase
MILAGPIIRDIADTYWASHFGCGSTGFRRPGVRVQHHAGELDGYHGVFALFREQSASISIPKALSRSMEDALRSLPPHAVPGDVAAILNPAAIRVIGPAAIGYANAIHASTGFARQLAIADEPSVQCLRAACDTEEWEHGGSDLTQAVCAGVFMGTELTALAGYQIWGGSIAHISVVTHPRYRGRGFARDAVSFITAHAVLAGLLAQYRTLAANLPSMRIAQGLGFQMYGTSIAIRLRPDAFPSSSPPPP